VLFNYNLIFQQSYSYQTECQQVEMFCETVILPNAVVAVGADAGNVVPIRRFSTLRKEARARVSKFDREFFV